VDWIGWGGLASGVVVGATSSWIAFRAGRAAERALRYSKEAVRVAEESTRTAESALALERQAFHDAHRPQKPPRVQLEYRSHGNSPIKDLYLPLIVPRDYWLSMTVFYIQGDERRSDWTELYANDHEGVYVHDVVGAGSAADAYRIRFHFRPPDGHRAPGNRWIELDPLENWTCPCGRPVDDPDGHWAWTLPVSPPTDEPIA
jgi:hypothetical protein